MSDVEVSVRRFFEEVWNQGNVAAAADFLAAEFTSHNTVDVTVLGPSDYGQSVLDYRVAFPDLRTTLEDVFASGDRVAVREPIAAPTAVTSWADPPPVGRSHRHGLRSSVSNPARPWRAGWRWTHGDCWTKSPDTSTRRSWCRPPGAGPFSQIANPYPRAQSSAGRFTGGRRVAERWITQEGLGAS